jgi:hypothetical protein
MPQGKMVAAIGPAAIEPYDPGTCHLAQPSSLSCGALYTAVRLLAGLACHKEGGLETSSPLDAHARLSFLSGQRDSVPFISHSSFR